ncbi:MAG: flagellar basal-body rod protein FlgF [Candidatus Nitricoxidivorans perseverans]|uniref:Flagellar basal-body rod protein FlgF n=1 Tax=Candidatus Nitricoxidivorans perseverans TaxID=2975601 RepID=A0AA49FN29_9PROT|nr:MAG: flagellar basal-body rod protein FlgF [Candidatus Nitricoxidivorans perseverans]
MDRLLYTAMSGASGTLSRQAAVAHNLANVTSTGYRAEEHRLRAVQVQAQGASRATALPTRAFAVDASTHTDFTPGPIMHTGRALDIAIEGRGWLALAMDDGTEAYTRNGSLELSVNGVLQTRAGIPVQGDGGPITVPPDVRIFVAQDGTISVVPESGAQNTVNVIGRLKLVNPPEGELARGGDGLFRLNTGDPAPMDEKVRAASGYIENSNVNPVDQMVAMISLARQFEMQMKMISSADQNDRTAAQILSAR